MFAMRWLLAAADLCDHGNQPIASRLSPSCRLSVSPLCQNCCCCASPSVSIPPQLLIFKSAVRAADASASCTSADNSADEEDARTGLGLWFCGVAVIRSALHAEGPGFEPQWNHGSFGCSTGSVWWRFLHLWSWLLHGAFQQKVPLSKVQTACLSFLVFYLLL